VLLTESALCANLWFHFGNKGEELPYFYFHHDGQGLFKTPDAEKEISWEMMPGGKILLEIDGVKSLWSGLIYREVFLGLISETSNEVIFLFNSDGLKEQWQAFSN
jgi:hypothetical protein